MGVTVGVGVAVGVALGTWVAILIVTKLGFTLTAGKGVATITNGLGVLVGVAVGMGAGVTVILNVLELVWLIAPSTDVIVMVMVTVVGWMTPVLMIGIHQLIFEMVAFRLRVVADTPVHALVESEATKFGGMILG